MHAALHKVAAVPWDKLDEQVKLWAREVREASYDMEDVLDTFLVRVKDDDDFADASMLQRAMKKISDLFSKGKARRDIALTIEGIERQLQEVSKQRARYKVDETLAIPATMTSMIDPRLPAMYIEVTQLIGIDKARGELISMLDLSRGDDMSNKKIMKMVSVLGIGGLGKTTIAKVLYDKLKLQFDCGAFVSVGRNPDLAKVFKDILFDLDQTKYENIHNTRRGVNLLIRELRKFLDNKRYFIVIDDIWERQSWHTIKLVLVENNLGSTIITTTRKFEVAREAGEVYELKPLCDDNSKRLFYTRIFGGQGKSLDNQPDELSDKILNKCDGVPLAIITMASLLAGKPTEDWSEIYTSIGFGHKDNRHVENTMKILSFSYYDLTPHLRNCLLYLSMFPEDYFIEKDRLIRMWIAEGFVHEKPGISLYQIGEGYFNELVNRSMIQGEEMKHYECGFIVWCHVHDMVLDLIRSLSTEENFVSIVDNDESQSPQKCARRLAHQNRNGEEFNPADMPKLRSFGAFNCVVHKRISFLSFKLLRVLAIESCGQEKADYTFSHSVAHPEQNKTIHLEHLGSLLHLRYLSLRYTRLDELPKEVGALKFLQTLDLERTGITKLPSTIGLLTMLVRLRAGCNTVIGGPDAVGKLASLEELEMGASHDEMYVRRFLMVLGSLRELRVLDTSMWNMMDESMQICFVQSLRNLQKIQTIRFFVIDRINVDTSRWEAAGFVLSHHLRAFQVTGIKFSTMPSCINPSLLPNLTNLLVEVDTMDDQDLESLARLPKLCYLKLVTLSTIKIDNIAGNGYFQNLCHLSMYNATVRFLPSKEDSVVSLHIWNGVDDVPFSFEKKDECSRVEAPSVMPSLEALTSAVHVRALKDGNGGCDSLGLEYVPCLQEVELYIHLDGVYAADVDEAEATLRNTIEVVHPNSPTLSFTYSGHLMKGSPVEDQVVDDNLVTTEEEESHEQVVSRKRRIHTDEEDY